MAQERGTSGLKLLLLVGDGGSPEGFTHPCSINAERGITFTAGMSEEDGFNCEDPDEIGWVLREKTKLSCAITGGGKVVMSDVPFFFEWLTSNESRNCKVKVDAPGGQTFTGAFHLSEFPLTGNKGEKMATSISLASDGEVVMAANA
jgi:hypothetical protein